MKLKTVFCDECRNDVNFTVENVSMTDKIRDKEYTYTGKKAFCSNCGAPIYVPEISDYNLQALYDVYRQSNGLISLDQVREIPKKYKIGKRPLSLLLGWGEQTYTRYCDGDVPTRQYSDILIHIYNDPEYYSLLLETNKNNLKSLTAYAKSLRAVKALLSINTSPGTKIETVTQYILYKCGDITPLAIQKALYYIQGFYYAFYKKFLFEEDCMATLHGPIYKDLYSKYKEYIFNPTAETISFDSSKFSIEEKAIYDSIINNICCYSGNVLSRLTCNEAPWLITRGNEPVAESSDQIIEKNLIRDYFVTVKAKYNMMNPCDIKEYSLDMFQRL